jgi:hypothetical protein
VGILCSMVEQTAWWLLDVYLVALIELNRNYFDSTQSD